MSVGFPAASEGDRRTLQLVMGAKRRGELRRRRDRGDVPQQPQRHRRYRQDAARRRHRTPRSDVLHLYQRQRSASQVQDRQDAAALRRARRSASGSTCRSSSIARRTSGCSATRSLTRANAASSRIEFGAEDGSRGDVDYFIEYFKAGLAAGGTRPAWPDTVGTLTPEATRWYCSRIVAGDAATDLPIVAHLHNDYGLGTINAITAAVVRIQGRLGHGQRLRRARGQREAARVRRRAARALRHRDSGFQVPQAARTGAFHGAR